MTSDYVMWLYKRKFLGWIKGPWDDDDIPQSRRNKPSVPNLNLGLDALFKKYYNKNKFPSPTQWNGPVPIILGLVLIVLWLSSGIYRIAEGEQGAILRFGRWHRTIVDTGLGWHIPYPFENIFIKKITEVNRINIGLTSLTNSTNLSNNTAQVFMLTGDENILDVNMTIFWFINDLKKYLFRAADPEVTVLVAAESAVREIIAQTPMEMALTKGKSEIVEKVKKLLQKLVDDYQIGIHILKVDLQRVDAPGPVIDAFRDVQSARADQERMTNEATGYRDAIIPQARGEAEKIIQEAKAEHDRLIAESEGEAENFRLVCKEYKQAPSITTKRMYLETIGSILKKTNKIIVDGKVKNILPHMAIPTLKTKSGKENDDAKSS